jgi:serine/threonine protein kinase
VRYYDSWVDRGVLHIEMEYCPRQSLRELVFRGPTAWEGTEADIVRLLRDVALALQHMHRNRVAHLDIKVRAEFMFLCGVHG